MHPRHVQKVDTSKVLKVHSAVSPPTSVKLDLLYFRSRLETTQRFIFIQRADGLRCIHARCLSEGSGKGTGLQSTHRAVAYIRSSVLSARVVCHQGGLFCEDGLSSQWSFLWGWSFITVVFSVGMVFHHSGLSFWVSLPTCFSVSESSQQTLRTRNWS